MLTILNNTSISFEKWTKNYDHENHHQTDTHSFSGYFAKDYINRVGLLIKLAKHWFSSGRKIVR